LEIFSNKPLWAAIIAWLIAQGIKNILEFIKFKKVRLNRLTGSGGMPSSHAATVMALTFSVGTRIGYGSPVFAVCAVLSFIVMYDATGVRRSAGNQAVAINLIFDIIEEQGVVIDKKLKEILGHSPIEVFAGAILGMLIGLLY